MPDDPYFDVKGKVIGYLDDNTETFIVQTDDGRVFLRWVGNDWAWPDAEQPGEYPGIGATLEFSTNWQEQKEYGKAGADLHL